MPPSFICRHQQLDFPEDGGLWHLGRRFLHGLDGLRHDATRALPLSSMGLVSEKLLEDAPENQDHPLLEFRYGNSQPTVGWMPVKSTRRVLGHSLVRTLDHSHSSRIRLLRTACFSRALRCTQAFAHLLARSLMRPRAQGKEAYFFELYASISYHSYPMCSHASLPRFTFLRPHLSYIGDDVDDEVDNDVDDHFFSVPLPSRFSLSTLLISS